jgi:hypothetical protein
VEIEAMSHLSKNKIVVFLLSAIALILLYVIGLIAMRWQVFFNIDRAGFTYPGRYAWPQIPEEVYPIPLSSRKANATLLLESIQNYRVLYLDLSGTSASDQDLRLATNLRDLETIALGGTNVSDQGLYRLLQIEGLKRISLPESGITQEGVNALVLLHPNPHLQVYYRGKSIQKELLLKSEKISHP